MPFAPAPTREPRPLTWLVAGLALCLSPLAQAAKPILPNSSPAMVPVVQPAPAAQVLPLPANAKDKGGNHDAPAKPARQPKPVEQEPLDKRSLVAKPSIATPKAPARTLHPAPAKTPAKQPGKAQAKLVAPGAVSPGARPATLHTPAIAAPLAAPALVVPGPRVIPGIDRKAWAGMRDRDAAEQAGIGPEIEPGATRDHPGTGESMPVGRRTAATNPGTGKSVDLVRGGFGADGFRRTRPGESASADDGDVRAAARRGRGMAASDDDEATGDDTKVFYEVTFGEASTGGMDGTTWKSPSGEKTGTILTQDENTVWVKITDSNGNYVLTKYERGKTPVDVFGTNDDKPRPDEESAPPPLTAEEQQELLERMPRPVDLAGQPVDDDAGQGGQAAPDSSEWISDLVLAGKPVDEDQARNPGAVPGDPVLTDLGLAGQPVDDDPDFGVVTPGGNGGGFGSQVARLRRVEHGASVEHGADGPAEPPQD